MRDSQATRTTHSRIRRRAVIVAVILAASPLGAHEPQVNSAHGLPPLPLMASTGGEIKANPFCVPDSGGYRIQLTSGKQPQAVRLKPVGVAVGLQPMRQPEGQSPQPPATTVESTPAPTVRNNRLVGSEHHENQHLVETNAAPIAQSHARALAVQNTAAILPSVSDVGPSVSDNAAAAIIDPQPPAQPKPRDQARRFDVALPVNTPLTESQAVPFRDSVPLSDPTPVVLTLPAPHAAPSRAASSVSSQSSINSAAPARAAAVTHHDLQRSEDGDSARSGRRSSIILISPTASVIQADTPVDVLPAPQPAQAAAFPQPQPRVDTANASDSPAAEPVFFSLSDDADPTADVSQTTADHPSGLGSEPTAPLEGNALGSVDAAAPREADLPEPIVIGARRAVTLNVSDQPQDSLQWIQPVVIDEQPKPAAAVPAVAELQPALAPLPVAIEEPATQADAKIIYRDEPVVTAPVAAAEATLHDTRYRPPVAVTQIPVAVGRGETHGSTAIIRPTVTPVQAPLLAQAEEIDSTESSAREKLTPLYMSRTQIRSLTIGGKLKGVQVGDKDVCQAFAAGANELKLIGTGNGVTQLVVWAETGSGDKTVMRAFEVHVEETVAVTGEAVEHRTAMLNRSIDTMFPGCNVQVTRQGDHLLVHGSCDSDETATKILRIVRKTCLVPVRDELEIR